MVEFGSYRGGSAMFMAKLAQIHLPGVQVFALDTFEGMPATDNSVDAHRPGDFSNTAFEEVETAKKTAGLDNLHVVKGLFEHTTPDVLQRSGPIALAHIDCDIYHPAIYAWDQVEPHMVPGGYVVFDDATEPSCLGAMQAVEEIICRHDLRSEQVDPHVVFRYAPLASET
jgi:predicted O-methyltransferase YrrM